MNARTRRELLTSFCFVVGGASFPQIFLHSETWGLWCLPLSLGAIGVALVRTVRARRAHEEMRQRMFAELHRRIEEGGSGAR
jgi:hypothetical protein